MHFQVGLAFVTVTSSRPGYYSGEVYPTSCAWHLNDFLNDWNIGSLPDQVNREVKPVLLALHKAHSIITVSCQIVQISSFKQTEGLCVFAMVLQVFVWLSMAAVQVSADRG